MDNKIALEEVVFKVNGTLIRIKSSADGRFILPPNIPENVRRSDIIRLAVNIFKAFNEET